VQCQVLSWPRLLLPLHTSCLAQSPIPIMLRAYGHNPLLYSTGQYRLCGPCARAYIRFVICALHFRVVNEVPDAAVQAYSLYSKGCCEDDGHQESTHDV
jgi:hypothetical protein